MSELLVEVGCEELPASFVRKAYADLQSALSARLLEAGIPFGQAIGMGTPRRLIVSIDNVADRQPDVQKEQRGPGVGAAYDSSGNPTKALEGFCRSQGLTPQDIRKEGEYVWVTKTIIGRPTAEVLAKLVPDAIRSLTFEKAMRWGHSRMRFARPLRWIVAAYAGKVVEFEVEGLRSGLESRGHRSCGQGSFAAASFAQLRAGLIERLVQPDPAEREKRIREQVLHLAPHAEIQDALVEENVFLTEWPTALESAFRDEFLELPAAVLVTAMAKHERFFPIRDADGKLTNRFISIRNGGVDEVVGKGNAWVLNARFNDAKFFFDEDREKRLGEFLEATKGIVFHQKLGTVHQRAMRLAELAHAVARASGADDHEAGLARMAGEYAKADLSTGLVSELPALQGLIGSEYARREVLPDPLCWAIGSQYDLSKNPTVGCEGARTAIRLVIADNLDKLAGYLGIGQAPKGSSDPFGLRRAATMLIEAALRWPTRLPNYAGLYSRALEIYRAQGFELGDSIEPLSDVFRSRYEAIFGEARHDVVDAALLDDYASKRDELDPQGVHFRIRVLERLAEDVVFVQTATRPQNILAHAVANGVPFAFEKPLDQVNLGKVGTEGRLLYDAALAAAEPLRAYVEHNAGSETASELKKLEGPINVFFDKTMVMSEDEGERFTRLSLLHGVNILLRNAGDFSKIVIPG